jgi:hypothetical protein
MRLTLLTLGGLWPWMKIVVLTSRCVKSSSTPMDRALTRLHETMAEITMECIASTSVKLCDHVASLIQGVRSNIHHLHGLA